MAQAATQTCPACRGRAVLNNARGQAQVCPVCGGTGSAASNPYRIPFDYPFNAVIAAGFGTTTVTLTIDQDSDFEHIFWVANGSGLFNVQISDTSTGRKLSNVPINGENFAGTAQNPFPLIEPYIWARSASVSAVFVDRSGNANTIQLTMKGYKLFPQNAPQQGSSGAVISG